MQAEESGAKRIKRVLLITIDSLRNSSTSLDVYFSIYRYFACISFTYTFSNGPGTNQSFPSIMTSTPFLAHGGMTLNPGIPSLTEILAKNNFYTVGFHSNPFLSSRFGWGRGFVEFYDFLGKYRSPAGFVVASADWKRFVINVVGKILKGSSRRLWSIVNRMYYRLKGFSLPYIEASELNKHVLEWVSRNYNRFNRVFLWVHYMDTHFPYAPPDEYLKGTGFSSRSEAFFYNYKLDFDNPDPQIVDNLKLLYRASVKYVFDSLIHLLEELDKLKFLENSLVVITGDHGEAFLEHGKFGHAYDILYNEVLRVPLFIGSNVLDFNLRSYNKPVQLMDLTPTILDLIGVKKASTFRGRSLAPLLWGEVSELDLYPIFAESAVPDLINLRYDTSRYIVSVILGEWKLIMDKIHSSLPAFELYDLKADPNEKRNLVEEHKDVKDNLMKLIELHLKDVAKLKMFSKRIEFLKLKLKRRRA